MIAAKFEVQTHMAECAIVVGPDAALHMSHYLWNTGADLTIRLRNMVDDVPSAKTLYDEELQRARDFAQTFPDGSHTFTSANGINGYNRQAESRNWFFAIGGYTVWGKGSVSVSSAGGMRTFVMNFEYKFYDRYNWDGGKSVTLAGITINDEFMGEFHRQGLAKEFDCFGSITDSFTWTRAGASPSPVVPLKPGPAPGGKVYTVVPGDSLWKIAQSFYGDGSQSERIYQANKGVIGANRNLIHPGQKLIIP
jgi:LysM repeat protein